MILRFFETVGKPAKSKISFFLPVKEAQETDLLERKTAELKVLEVDINPFEIKTVKLKIGGTDGWRR